MTLYTFDIFDTVLTRLVARPVDVFRLLGLRLSSNGLSKLSPEIFCEKRIAAEQHARQKRGSEITLSEIYAELAEEMTWKQEEINAAMAEELSVEAALLRPLRPGVDAVRRARKEGSVAFISDVYLPCNFVRRLLVSGQISGPDDPIYISCEHGCAKANGSLFQYVLSDAGVKPGDVVHFGDHPRSDYLIPRRMGIRSTQHGHANLSRRERQLLSISDRAGTPIASAFAGISRFLRTNDQTASERERQIVEIAASIAAPALCSYVLWVLREAVKCGLQRLYFIARDGQILFDLALILNKALQLPLDLRYVYGSRAAWHLPTAGPLTDRHMAWVLEQTPVATLDNVLERVALTRKDVREQLIAAGMSSNDGQRVLDGSELQKLSAILRDPSVATLIAERAAPRRELAVAYLQQEGFASDVPWAIVETGWRGRLQVSLGDLLAAAQSGRAPRTTGFYMGLWSAPLGGERDRFVTYLFAGTDVSAASHELPYLVEVFTSATHGSTIGYQQVGERIQPVLRSEDNVRVMRWGFPLYRQTVLQFAQELTSLPSFSELSEPRGTDLLSLLDDFVRRPTRNEADALHNFPHETDISGKDVAPLCVPRSIRATLRGALPGPWISGAIAMSPEPTRALLRLARSLRSLIKYGRLG